MKKKTLFLSFVLSLCASSIPAHGQSREWTLKACIDYALENNLDLHKARLASESAATDVKEAKAALQPTLSASMTQGVQYRPFQERTGSFVNGSIASSSSQKVTQSGSYGINMNWVVWNGGRNRDGITEAEYSEQQANLNIQQTANSIQEQIASLYVQILYSKEAENVNRELLENDKKLLARGRELLAEGQVARSDVAQLEAQVSSGEYEVVNAVTQIADYKLQLKQLLELKGEEELEISPIEVADKTIQIPVPSVSEVYQTALTLRPEIKSGQIGMKQAALAVKQAKAARKPTISLTAGLGDSHMTGTQSNYFTQMKNNFDGSVGVSLSIPIFDNRSTKSAVERAEIDQLTSELELQDTQKSLYSAIESYRLAAINYQQRYRASLSNVKSLEESYALMSEQFRIGSENIAELLNSRSSLLEARQELLQNKYTALLNMALLNFYRGESLEL